VKKAFQPSVIIAMIHNVLLLVGIALIIDFAMYMYVFHNVQIEPPDASWLYYMGNAPGGV
jgi:hypothetical protein